MANQYTHSKQPREKCVYGNAMIRLSINGFFLVVIYAAGVATGYFSHSEDSIKKVELEYARSISVTEQGYGMSMKPNEPYSELQAVTSKHKAPGDENMAAQEFSSDIDEQKQASDYEVALKNSEAKNQLVSEMLSKVEEDKANVGEYLDVIAQVEPSTKDALLMYAGAYTVQCGRAPDSKMLRNALWEHDPYLSNAVAWLQLHKLSDQAKDGVEKAMEQLPSIDCRFN